MAQDPHKAAAVSAEVRGKRKVFRRDARRTDVAQALASPPGYLETADVEWILRAAPGIGAIAAEEILRTQQISPRRRLGQLTRRQRRNLAEAVRS